VLTGNEKMHRVANQGGGKGCRIKDTREEVLTTSERKMRRVNSCPPGRGPENALFLRVHQPRGREKTPEKKGQADEAANVYNLKRPKIRGGGETPCKTLQDKGVKFVMGQTRGQIQHRNSAQKRIDLEELQLNKIIGGERTRRAGKKKKKA